MIIFHHNRLNLRIKVERVRVFGRADLGSAYRVLAQRVLILAVQKPGGQDSNVPLKMHDTAQKTRTLICVKIIFYEVKA
ncbi:hypothetical protein OfM2_07350 [Lactovum odontotermitis]